MNRIDVVRVRANFKFKLKFKKCQIYQMAWFFFLQIFTVVVFLEQIDRHFGYENLIEPP